MLLRFFADNFLARATPPFFPPNRPNATAAGFFSDGEPLLAVARLTIVAASWLRSLGIPFVLERLGMVGPSHNAPRLCNGKDSGTD